MAELCECDEIIFDFTWRCDNETVCDQNVYSRSYEWQPKTTFENRKFAGFSCTDRTLTNIGLCAKDD